MILSTGTIVGLLALAAAWATWQLLRAVRAWRLWRGARLVTCPATGGPAVVRVDAARAAVNTLVLNSPETRITECSLWATCGSCDRGCMQEALAQGSALRTVVHHWYLHRTCVYCGRLIGTEQSFGHRAALVTPEGVTREWSDLPADSVLDALKTDRPVCWDCHVAETFRRLHPELVTERPWQKESDRRAG